MEEVLTASITVVVGVVVFVAGQIVVRFMIDPVHEQKKHVGLIADALIFYADIYSNPGVIDAEEVVKEASATLRSLAGQLMAKSNGVPLYWLLGALWLVPKWDSVLVARRELIGLSHSLVRGDPAQNSKSRERIERELGIRTQ